MSCFATNAGLTAFILFLFLINTTMAQFNNLVLDITREATPDPYITYANGLFFMVSQYASDDKPVIDMVRHSRPATASKYGKPILYHNSTVLRKST